MMHGREKSDPAIVAMKPANKAASAAAELVERRAGAEALCANDDETPAPFEFRLGHRRMTSWLCPTQMAQST